MPTPSKELARYNSWLGTWKGSGKWVMQPGAPEAGWTSITSYSKVMNGFWIREDNRIELQGMPPGMPNALVFTSILGWDPENNRHVKIEVSNEGTANMSETIWMADGSFVSVSARPTGSPEGLPTVGRWVGRQQDNVITFDGEGATGTGEFFKQVWGSMEKVADEPGSVNTDVAAFMGADMTHISKLKGMVGTYRNKGWYTMAPGAPKTEFSGTETITSQFGGTILGFHVKSDPMEDMGGARYEMLMWMAWDSHANRYKMYYASNMGEVGVNDAWLMPDGKTMISMNMGTYMGQPMAGRGILSINDDGSPKQMVGHALMGAGEPMKNFVNAYTKQDG